MQPDEFARQAGLHFQDAGLLRRALTHRSYINEHPDVPEDNERLEFLGDAALDLLSAAWLFRRFPEMDEGELTRMRSVMVRTEQLADFAGELHLGEAILLGRGEDSMGGRTRLAMLCDAFEAMIGALYLDAGLEAVIRFMEPRFERSIRDALEDQSVLDPRSRLQMWAQSELSQTPRYETVDAFGPDHAREFVVEVSLGTQVAGQGRGRSKQEAAQGAAADALSHLDSLNGRRPRGSA
jgi:ribonuclease-3